MSLRPRTRPRRPPLVTRSLLRRRAIPHQWLPRAKPPSMSVTRRRFDSRRLQHRPARGECGARGGSATLELRDPPGPFSRAQLPITTSSTSPMVRRRPSRARLRAAARRRRLTLGADISSGTLEFSPATSSTHRPATTASRCSGISSTIVLDPSSSTASSFARGVRGLLAGYQDWDRLWRGWGYLPRERDHFGYRRASGGDSQHTRWGRLLGGNS